MPRQRRAGRPAGAEARPEPDPVSALRGVCEKPDGRHAAVHGESDLRPGPAEHLRVPAVAADAAAGERNSAAGPLGGPEGPPLRLSEGPPDVWLALPRRAHQL